MSAQAFVLRLSCSEAETEPQGAEADNNVNEQRERSVTECEWTSTGFPENDVTPSGDVTQPCGPCLEDEEPRRVQAVAICLECSERLCKECRKQHGRFRQTRGHHTYLIGERESETDLPQTEMCQEHREQSLELYCRAHGESVCRLCRLITHNQCEGVVSIAEEASGVRTSEDMASYRTNIADLLSRIIDTVKKKNAYKDRIENQESEAITRINGLANVAIEVVNKLAKEAEDEVRTKSKDVILQVDSELDTLDTVYKTMHGVSAKMDTVLNTTNDSQIFISLKGALKKLDMYMGFLDELVCRTREIELKFYTNRQFEGMLQSVTSMGSIHPEDEVASLCSSLGSASSLRKRCNDAKNIRKKAQPIGGHSIRINADKTTCCISGCKFLPGKRLVCADYNNRRIKLFDEKIKLLYEVTLKSRPYELAVVDKTTVLTLLIEEQCFQFLSIVRNTIQLDRRVPAACHYSAFDFSPHTNELFTAEEGTGKLHVLDLNGRELRTISCDLVRPTAIFIDAECDMLYVNDTGRNCVVGIDLIPDNGRAREEPVFHYTDRHLELRNAVIADNDGNVYVSGGNSVHQITCEGSKVCEPLTSVDGLGLAHCFAFCPERNILLVAEYKENTVKLFSLVQY